MSAQRAPADTAGCAAFTVPPLLSEIGRRSVKSVGLARTRALARVVGRRRALGRAAREAPPAASATAPIRSVAALQSSNSSTVISRGVCRFMILAPSELKKERII